MTAQPDEHPMDPRVQPIPHTIDAVANTLTGAKRMAFYADIGQAEAGEALNNALRKWWMEAMFDTRPDREQRLDDTDAGRNLALLPPPADGDQ